MKHALILQGWYQKPNSNWYPWLKAELKEQGYQVNLPDLPTIYTNSPKCDQMLDFLTRQNFITPDTIIIGHSMGAVLALKIAEMQPIKQLILVSGWDFNDLTPEHQSFWANPIIHNAIKTHVKKVVVIHSNNDPYINQFQAKNMANRLNGKFILIKGAGHFTQKDGITKIPETLEFI